ncbi:hypothetical protein [Candidatus Bacteroides intestinigallinarum]|uniref:hypothetical protein n=1 Tax=Candidatus Bacteroides intestinigallinarum TaxID=2838470 RepID=UPI0022E6F8D5|nr:hypothetical protein [Candidatus Bacteroides intestinigallinarum]
MESNESKELKTLFIEEELSQHGEWLCDILTEAIETRKLMQTDALHDSIDYKTFHDGENPGLKVSFFSYGRAFEIAGNKKNRHQVDTNRMVWGMKANRNPVKKNTRWYAKNMYGGLNRLISRVMYGLSDAEIARLKGILENRKLNYNG